jgi:hypothetical protein
MYASFGQPSAESENHQKAVNLRTSCGLLFAPAHQGGDI